MSTVRFAGMGPDRSTLVAAADDGSGMKVGIQLLGARFSIDVETARWIARAIDDACDAISTPNGLYGRPVMDADQADGPTVDAAIAQYRRRSVQ